MNVKKENKSVGRVLLQEREREGKITFMLAWSLTVLEELNDQIKKSSKSPSLSKLKPGGNPNILILLKKRLTYSKICWWWATSI